MMKWRFGVVALAFALAACGQSAPPAEPGVSEAPVVTDEPDDETVRVALPQVDASLQGAPSALFTAIEPSEVGIFGAPTVMQSLEPLLGVEGQEGGESLFLSVNEQADAAVADIVRTGIPDDSVSGGHVRIEYRREPDGWYPTNAYRRVMCGRGAEAGQWTIGLCP